MARWTMVRRFLSLALVAAVTACSEPTRPDASATALTLFPEIKKSGLVECPTDEFLTASAYLDPLALVDQVVSVGAHSVSVPPGALPLGVPPLLTLTVPPSKYVEIVVTVNGLPHFQFAEPVTVTIDYSRCNRSDIDRDPLRVWNIDPLFKTFIADMGGDDDKVARTVTFQTDHFSGYAIAQ